MRFNARKGAATWLREIIQVVQARVRCCWREAVHDTLVNLTIYTYDNVGNRTRAVESGGEVTSWTYDASYQLTHEVRSGSHSFDVTYTSTRRETG